MQLGQQLSLERSSINLGMTSAAEIDALCGICTANAAVGICWQAQHRLKKNMHLHRWKTSRRTSDCSGICLSRCAATLYNSAMVWARMECELRFAAPFEFEVHAKDKLRP